MTRHFSDRPLREDQISMILNTALIAPSAGNTHATRLLVVLKELDKFWSLWPQNEAYISKTGPKNAPAIVVVLTSGAEYEKRYSKADKAATPLNLNTVAFHVLDAGFVALQIMLVAHDSGISSLFFRLPEDQSPFLNHFLVPPSWMAVGAIALGYSLGAVSKPSQKRPVKRYEQIFFEYWDNLAADYL
jgi:nitroreductase